MPSEIGTSMLTRRAFQRRKRALKERPARIGRDRQRDQRRQPVKQVARLRRDVGGIAGPDRHRQQHDIHRAEARHRKAEQKLLAALRLLVADTRRVERIGAITEPFQRIDHLRRVELDGAPAIDSRSVVKFTRASCTPGSAATAFSIRPMQPAQLMPSTASVRCAGRHRTPHEVRKIAPASRS